MQQFAASDPANGRVPLWRGWSEADAFARGQGGMLCTGTHNEQVVLYAGGRSVWSGGKQVDLKSRLSCSHLISLQLHLSAIYVL